MDRAEREFKLLARDGLADAASVLEYARRLKRGGQTAKAINLLERYKSSFGQLALVHQLALYHAVAGRLETGAGPKNCAGTLSTAAKCLALRTTLIFISTAWPS